MKKITKFYDKEFLKIDSINKSKGSTMHTNSESDQLVIRKTNNEAVTFFFPCMNKFTKIDPFDKNKFTIFELCNKHIGLAKAGFGLI